ncbi:MAG TPA: PASTA domain-containing protein [Gaiellaceae bacterium]|nr:PASTA domain-containing protein [Gaiellaceae bacterium]
MRYLLLALVALLPAVTACGGAGAERAPDVTGERLDVAQERLDDRGLEYEVIGGGALGVVVRSHWVVCEQRPRAGKRTKSVELVIARSCPAVVTARVPNVTGLRLDAAKRLVEDRGLEAVVVDQGLGEVLVESNWTVCDQWPYAGERAHSVELYVEHFCDNEDDDDDDF